MECQFTAHPFISSPLLTRFSQSSHQHRLQLDMWVSRKQRIFDESFDNCFLNLLFLFLQKSLCEHLSPLYGANERKCYRLYKGKWSPWISVSTTANFFGIGWTIFEKSQPELDPKWICLCDLLPTGSNWWRHLRLQCKRLLSAMLHEIPKLLALVVSEKIKFSHLRNA